MKWERLIKQRCCTWCSRWIELISEIYCRRVLFTNRPAVDDMLNYHYVSQIKQARNMILHRQIHRPVRPFVLLSKSHPPIGPETWNRMYKIWAVRSLDSPNKSDQCQTFPRIWTITTPYQSDIHFCEVKTYKRAHTHTRVHITKYMRFVKLKTVFSFVFKILTSIGMEFHLGTCNFRFLCKWCHPQLYTTLSQHFSLSSQLAAGSLGQCDLHLDRGT